MPELAEIEINFPDGGWHEWNKTVILVGQMLPSKLKEIGEWQSAETPDRHSPL